jgi:ELWxxDGT repeat protein
LLFSVYSGTLDDGFLWSSDGTPEGTRRISTPEAICAAPCQSLRPVLTRKDGGVLLLADSGASGARLWRTDGTEAGTAPFSRGRVSVVAVTDEPAPSIYFYDCQDPHGCGLWRSDGAPGGTRRIPDVLSGLQVENYLRVWNGKLFFVVAEEHGPALWATDWTPEGTFRLADYYEGDDEISVTQLLAATPSHLFFTNGYRDEIWITNGTPGGTRKVRSFEAAPCYNHYFCQAPYTDALVLLNGEVYFVAADKKGVDFWKSDGTLEGTRRLTRLPDKVLPVGETLRRTSGGWLFTVRTETGRVLWRSAADFSVAAPLTGCEGGCPVVDSFLGSIGTSGRQFLGAEDPAHGSELWVTDGTGPGTRRLTDACPGPCPAVDPYGSTPLGSFPGGTYFKLGTGEGGLSSLWVSDGTPHGTRRLAGEPSSGLAAYRGRAFFSPPYASPFAAEVWETDGSPAGTRRAFSVKVTAPGSSPWFFPRAGGALLEVWNGRERSFWRSDGTPAGTFPLGPLKLGRNEYVDLVTAGPLQFFKYGRPGPRPGSPWTAELWRTDGTARGTLRVAGLGGGSFGDAPPVDWNGRLLFPVSDSDRCGFWASDGTARGTRELFRLPDGVRCPVRVQPLGETFAFMARAPGNPGGLAPQLFLSDGTSAGTRQVSRIEGTRYAWADLLRAGTSLVFQIPGRVEGYEVWSSDGTPGGTRLILRERLYSAELFSFHGALYSLNLPEESLDPPYQLRRIPLNGDSPVLLSDKAQSHGITGDSAAPVLAGGRIFFTAGDEAHGHELWSTDGTPEGTRLVRDILPGPGSSEPVELAAAGDRVFFSAHDGEHGWELWESDGTGEGTRMVADLNPGPASSAPSGLAVSGATLFFSADDGVTGREPWALPLLIPPR